MREPAIVGWDIGGAHVKAAWLGRGGLEDAAQWACPLWQGTDALERVFAAAQERWPHLAGAAHAVTMTGEMVDHFAHREDGVQRIAALAATALPSPRFFAGDDGWCSAEQAATHWPAIASANWLATARHVALARPEAAGLLVDIGSTTTDLIAFRGGRVLVRSRRDVDRLASGELVYQGVVRTPLCALGPRIGWLGIAHNVMNEFFATTADAYRLTGELDPEHDQHPAADGGAKTAAGSRARLARMIGLDARDGRDDDWAAFARAWRQAQVAQLRGQLQRVAAAQGLGGGAIAVAAGCGAFLVPDLLPPRWPCLAYGRDIAQAAPAHARWADVAAPAVAVAALFQREQG
jgi:(4-(4-[2-(gamma-L-glutamylamino)ethyl]phenoxymethyl)furan-2-yl)methanamine synthase